MMQPAAVALMAHQPVLVPPSYAVKHIQAQAQICTQACEASPETKTFKSDVWQRPK
jgi:hypothetical protein